MNANDLKKVFDMLMCTPGMEEQVKVDFKISRKTALFLVQCLQQGMQHKDEGAITNLLDEQSGSVLSELATGILERAGLSNLNSSLAALLKH